MSDSERIGLLPGFGWLAGQGFWATLGICWLLAPIGVWVAQVAIDRDMIDWSRNYLSFFPGDLFLGAFAAAMLTLSRSIPAERHWFNSVWWHVLVLAFTLSAAVCLCWNDYRQKMFQRHELFKAARMYHDIGLYGLYGYVLVSTSIAVIASGSWNARIGLLAVAIIGFSVWLALVLIDSSVMGVNKNA